MSKKFLSVFRVGEVGWLWGAFCFSLTDWVARGRDVL